MIWTLGKSYLAIMEVGTGSIVGDIKQQHDKMLSLKWEMVEMGTNTTKHYSYDAPVL